MEAPIARPHNGDEAEERVARSNKRPQHNDSVAEEATDRDFTENGDDEAEYDDDDEAVEEAEQEDQHDLEYKLQRLNLMLQQASAYSQFISQRLRLPGLPSAATNQQQPAAASSSTPNGDGSTSMSTPPPSAAKKASTSTTAANGTPPAQRNSSTTSRSAKKRSLPDPHANSPEKEAHMEPTKTAESNGEHQNGTGEKRKRQKTDSISQPEMLTGGALRDYQLVGVAWLASLYENGINGILADEMGLGKTIQTVAFLTHLYGKGVKGPFLVVGPLSTLANWVKEIQKWAPTMPVLLYHGTKEERIELRKKALPAIVSSKKGIVVTSFEISIKDRSALQRKHWKYLVVDEGHRIKNMHCRLIKELKAYDSANRLLLTGTPLQNNLTELWSLLSFLMPSIFDDLDAFQRWFNFEGVGKEEGNKRILTAEKKNQLVTKLHLILKPFLLRRVKADVEMELPKKEERIITTVLTPLQQKFYQAIINKKLYELLATSSAKVKFQGTGLQNLLMQLRKCCNHPYLFEWPVDSKGEEIIDERLVKSSGKLQMLDRLLPRLLEEGHRVLFFSQMTRMLDILEDYLNLRGYSFFRIDGTTPQPDRQAQIEQFNAGERFCFMLSTRAGGLGINLTGADVVIFIDSDWNPQMDLQAQDRAHRIGQTRNVRIYRLVTGKSIESMIVERAANKMKLGAMVLAGTAHSKKAFELDELANLLHDSSLTQPLTEPLPITEELLFKWGDN